MGMSGCLLAVTLLAIPCGAAAAGADTDTDFVQAIKPILTRHCVRCHGPDRQKSALRLDTAASVLEGGNRGPSVTPARSGESLLVDAVRGRRDIPVMPPEGDRLTENEIAAIERWIDAGAPAPPGEQPEPPRSPASRHWSFLPIQSPVAPEVRPSEGTGQGTHNAIDAFVLDRLQQAGLKPSPEADRTTLIRRLSLDLLGLPPEPESVDAFVSDDRPDAMERLVDRLLSSPHFGERWGRHWLDGARYADSNGYTIDGSRSIWKYRDWVISAFNADMPFDQFTIEQLAGDLLPEATLDQILATGFHRNTLRNEEGGTDQEQFRNEAVADRVSTTGSVFLGLTIGCARCHDHKYDPISQREYYQLFAIFNNADEPTVQVPTDQQARELPAIATELASAEKLLADNEVSVVGRQQIWERDLVGKSGVDLEKLGIPPEPRGLLQKAVGDRSEADKTVLAKLYRSIDKDYAPLVERVAGLKKRQADLRKSVTTSLVMKERVEPRATHVQIRGDFLRPGARVEGAAPAVLPALRPAGAKVNRLDLARWIASPRNPLSARVVVNRLWQTLFGQGIVATDNDLGTQGSPPTHPELLDWLASELIRREWSIKSTLKLIVSSATYRQASTGRGDLVQHDPYNRLLGRQPRLRLEAECVRDVALAVSGLLSREIGGPGVYPPQPQGIYRFTQTAKFWKESEGGDRFRRGMYTYFWRSSPYPFLTTFDAPDATLACTRRPRSNTPLQALTLANDPAFVEMARALAKRALAEAEGSSAERIRRMFRLCFSREPEAREIERLSKFVTDQQRAFAATPSGADAPEGLAWTALARVLLNLDELITRE